MGYALTVAYMAMTEEEYDAYAENENPTEEELQELNSKCVLLVNLGALRDGIEPADIMSEPEDLKAVAQAGGVTWYAGPAGDPSALTDSKYREEFDRLAAALPEVYEMTEFYEPVDLYAGMKGKHIEFTTLDLDGSPVDSAELFSKHAYTAVNLWATWCTFCVEEMPELDALNERLADADCAIVGLLHDSAKSGKLEKGREIVAQTGVRYTMLQAPENVDSLFLVPQGFPITYIVDLEGNVVGSPIVGMDVEEVEAALLAAAGK